MTSGPLVKWDSVKGEMKMMWTRWRPKRRWPTARMRVRSQSQSTVRADRWTVGALLEIELPRGVAPTYPWGQVRGMCGAAEEMGHRVIGRVAVGEGRVIGPDYEMAVELEPRAVALTGLGEGDSVRLGSNCLTGSIGRGWPWALCWLPETGRSPPSSGLVVGVRVRDKHPPPARHYRWGEGRWCRHFLPAGLLECGDLKPGG